MYIKPKKILDQNIFSKPSIQFAIKQHGLVASYITAILTFQ